MRTKGGPLSSRRLFGTGLTEGGGLLNWDRMSQFPASTRLQVTAPISPQNLPPVTQVFRNKFRVEKQFPGVGRVTQIRRRESLFRSTVM